MWNKLPQCESQYWQYIVIFLSYFWMWPLVTYLVSKWDVFLIDHTVFISLYYSGLDLKSSSDSITVVSSELVYWVSSCVNSTIDLAHVHCEQGWSFSLGTWCLLGCSTTTKGIISSSQNQAEFLFCFISHFYLTQGEDLKWVTKWVTDLFMLDFQLSECIPIQSLITC